ncbi:hypothetical protein C8R41DRAFT_866314 [Lentinula lateritia]|uniref:Uncharacterized protein n=1 Tax=Lentinula lateritia TaxID=40482 RepID=A0ABQ8VM43_9AGAR|nr:hypothetical protein C8R41DRAFT_866314 [Lentinula lateritia]
MAQRRFSYRQRNITIPPGKSPAFYTAARNRKSDKLSKPLQTRPAELPLQDVALFTPPSVSSSRHLLQDVTLPLPTTISLPLGSIPAVPSPQDVITHTPTESFSPQYVAHSPPSSPPPPPPAESSSTAVNHSVPSYSQPHSALLELDHVLDDEDMEQIAPKLPIICAPEHEVRMQLTQADQLPHKSDFLDTSSTMIPCSDSLPPVGYSSTALGKRRAEDPSIGEPIGPSGSSYDVQQMNGASGVLKSQRRARTGAKRVRMELPTLGKRVHRKYLFEGPAPQNNNPSPPFTFEFSTSSSVPFHPQDVDRHEFPLSGRDSGPSHVAANNGLQSNDLPLWADGSDAEDEDITEALPESELHRRSPPSNRSRSPQLIAPTGSIPPQISHHPTRTLNEDGGDADDEEENERPTQGPREVHADAGQALSEVPAFLNHQKVDIGAAIMNVDMHSIRPAATQRVPPRVGVEEVTDEEFNRPSTACGPSIGSLRSPAHTPTHNVPRPPSQSGDNTDSSTPHSAQCPTRHQKVVETVDASIGAASQKKQSIPLHVNSEKAHPEESNHQLATLLEPMSKSTTMTKQCPLSQNRILGLNLPPPKHTADNANERFLRDEIIRLIETEVKTRNMQSHFRKLLEAPVPDLSTILHHLYHYLATIHNLDPTGIIFQDRPAAVNEQSEPKEPKTKRWSKTKHRPTTQVSMAESIRLEVKALMEPTFVEDRMISVPSYVIEDWKHSRHPGPTVDDFLLQLEGKGKWTSWNKAAADIFAVHFVSLDGHKHYSKATIQKAFRAHLSNLKEKFQKQGSGSNPEEEDQARLERRMARRNRLLTRRIEAFYQVHPSLAKLDELAKVITLLTAEAISGDETADGSSRHKYFITKVEWRSKELSDFLGYLTAL